MAEEYVTQREMAQFETRIVERLGQLEVRLVGLIGGLETRLIKYMVGLLFVQAGLIVALIQVFN